MVRECLLLGAAGKLESPEPTLPRSLKQATEGDSSRDSREDPWGLGGYERVPHPALCQHPRPFLFLVAYEETPACRHVPRERPVVERPVLS